MPLSRPCYSDHVYHHSTSIHLPSSTYLASTSVVPPGQARHERHPKDLQALIRPSALPVEVSVLQQPQTPCIVMSISLPLSIMLLPGFTWPCNKQYTVC